MADVRTLLMALDAKPITRSAATPFVDGFTGTLTVKINDAASRPGVCRTELSFATSPGDNHDFLLRSEVAAGHTCKVVIAQRSGAPVGQEIVDIRRIGLHDDDAPDRYEIDLDVVEDTVTGPLSVQFLWPFAGVTA